jgi:hypothetical protein
MDAIFLVMAVLFCPWQQMYYLVWMDINRFQQCIHGA